ncbi:MAG TPA: Vms1/Ankzf1 family peptidyl-tRNA hydrolase [Longimicrobiaceae bacterium]|nr:Vms1/Ankzf1 family peptidyl-tRNA hydrolase [Longimicrobiaceae bacterium]
MISKQDLERLIAREGGDHKILSLFLDMSVNSDNKRTHQVFLAQREGQFRELESERAGHSREAIGAAFGRIRDWLDNEFDEENRGVVIYVELDGDWFEALQFPVTVQNRMVIGPRPAIGPLAQVIESYHHHGVILLDREHVRILSVYLGTLMDEIEVRGKPLDIAHDIQAGGYSQQRYQRRKLEEMKHFFREFTREVEAFERRYQPEDFVILGTDENVARFMEFLPDRIRDLVAYTGPMRVDELSSEVLERLEPHLEELRVQEAQEVLQRLRERAQQDYLATAGFQSTLSALQEGKVDTLIIERDGDGEEGSRCPTCGFVFALEVKTCPYDGTSTTAGVNLVEEAIRMAEAQGAEVQFVSPSTADDLRGVGSLLRF